MVGAESSCDQTYLAISGKLPMTRGKDIPVTFFLTHRLFLQMQFLCLRIGHLQHYDSNLMGLEALPTHPVC